MHDSLFDDAPPPRSAVMAAPAAEALQRLGRRLSPLLHLGTSSWSFPGWQGLVYDGSYTEAQLAREGLVAYAEHPVLRTVSIDRSFYQPLTTAQYARYAAQVPPHFRFMVKAPAHATDAMLRAEGGLPERANPRFLDVAWTAEQFVRPALQGLGAKAGPLVFQLSPLPRGALTDPAAGIELIERLASFFAALPGAVDEQVPLYALELRNPELLTPRLVRALRAAGVRLVIGVHARMPPAARQSAALRALDALAEEGDDWLLKGPLVVRWNLHAGLRYDDAKRRYAPFDRLIDPDLVTRGTLAHLLHVAIRSGQPAFVIANNKAEGSAPLSMIELARAVVGDG